MYNIHPGFRTEAFILSCRTWCLMCMYMWSLDAKRCCHTIYIPYSCYSKFQVNSDNVMSDGFCNLDLSSTTNKECSNVYKMDIECDGGTNQGCLYFKLTGLSGMCAGYMLAACSISNLWILLGHGLLQGCYSLISCFLSTSLIENSPAKTHCKVYLIDVWARSL